MSDENDTGNDGGDRRMLNRRRVLTGLGITALGFGMTGTASAHQNKFFGCEEVCTDTDGNLAVVAVDSGYELRGIEWGEGRADTPWDWQSHCYAAADGEAIVGIIEEDVWQGTTKTEDGQCELCLNPNACAAGLYDRPADVVDALNADAEYDFCRGKVVLEEGCTAVGTDSVVRDEDCETLVADDASAGDRFGEAVAVDDGGNRVVVGAPKATDPTPEDPVDPGAAYVFEDDGTGWSQIATLSPSDAADADAFGWAVDVDAAGDTVIVGAPGNRAAYVFEDDGTGWSQTQRLAPAEGEPGDSFGAAVAIDGAGDTAFVGAPFSNEPIGVPSVGAVYAFEAAGGTWSQVDEIYQDDLSSSGDDTAIGAALDLGVAGENGLIGAPGAGPDRPGFANVVENGADWTDVQRLQPAGLEDLEQFGGAVALDAYATAALVGAPGDEVDGEVRHGSVYVFDADGGTWSQQALLTASDGAAQDRFGAATALDEDGDLALVGAPAPRASRSDPGSAHAFVEEGGTWRQVATLATDDGADGDEFGAALALDGCGNTAAVGAPGDDEAATDAGAVCVFDDSAWMG